MTRRERRNKSRQKDFLKNYYKWLRDESVPIKERVDSTWNKQGYYLTHLKHITLEEKDAFYKLFKLRSEIKKAHKKYLKEQKTAQKADR